MTKVIVSDGQCLFDIALQECGHVSAAFGLATDNDLGRDGCARRRPGAGGE